MQWLINGDNKNREVNMKSYKEMKEMIEAQNKAIEYLFQTVDDHCKRIEELEKEAHEKGQ